MTNSTIAISTQTPASPDMDYAFLRQEAMAHLQRLSGKVWTDHNLHDPGITTLELLAYAITDLGYRTEYAVKDLLAEHNPNDAAQNHYTAAQILSCNPLTINDYRKLLLDVPGIRNAWLEPIKTRIDHINIKGLYDVAIELNDDDRWGDLNQRSLKVKVEQEPYAEDNMFVELSIVSELDWENIDSIISVEMLNRERDFFKYGDFLYAHQANLSLKVKLKNGTLQTRPMQVRVDLLGDENPQDFVIPNLGIGNFIIIDPQEKKVRQGSDWYFFVYDENEPIPYEDDDILLNHSTYANAIIELLSGKAFLALLNVEYLPKQTYIAEIMREAQQRLSTSRNLCEDFNALKVVFIQEIAINADIEIQPNADPETVFAELYYQISQYLSPEIKRYTLENLMEKGKYVSDIFEGFLPQNGFIDDDELRRIEKKTVIYASSLISIIMDLPGVLSVKSISLSHYINGLLNLKNQSDFIPLVNPSLYLPRISPDKSNIEFYKNNVVEKFNAKSAINHFEILKHQRKQAPILHFQNDIPIEKGKPRQVAAYYSIQNDFPPVYGIGDIGLSETESPERRAKALQFKGYLLFFEQLLANYLSQLANINQLFSYNSDFSPQSYYFQSLKNVSDIDKLIIEWDKNQQNYDALLSQIVETPNTFLQRKNRFLDHLMARFGERFTEYAQLMYAMHSEEASDMRRIADRINGAQFEQSLKDSIALAQDSLEEMIRRSVKMDIKHEVVKLFKQYGTDPKVANAAKDAIKEALSGDIQKTLNDTFKEAVKSGIKSGIDEIIAEIIAELVKKAGDDPQKQEQIIEERKAIKSRLEILASQEADKIFNNDNISRQLFENTIKNAVFAGIDQIINEVMSELLANISKEKTEKDADVKSRKIPDIVKSIIVRSVSVKVKKTVLDAVKNVVWAAQDRVSREINAKTQAELINQKIALLQQISHAGAMRGQANPYQTHRNGKQQWAINVGFSQRIARLMGIEQPEAEPFYVVEHLLLRTMPNYSQQTNLLIAQLKNILGLKDNKLDYYSFQFSVLAANNAGRFANERFRALFEKTLQLEAPAHLVLYIHWLNETDMQNVQHIFKQLTNE